MKEVLHIIDRPNMGNDLVRGWTDLKEGKNGMPDKWSYYIEMKGLDPEKIYNISISEVDSVDFHGIKPKNG